MKKIKLIALLLAALTMTAVFTGCGKSYSEGLEFELNADGTSYVVVGIGSCKDTKINIPPQYEGLPVTGVCSRAFEDCENLKSVTIPEGVTEILRYAFSGCTSLESLTIPESVTRIDQYAFCACTSLKSLAIPGSVTHIGEGTFYMCTSLTRLPFGGTVAQWREAAGSAQAAGFNCEIICTDGTVDVICP